MDALTRTLRDLIMSRATDAAARGEPAPAPEFELNGAFLTAYDRTPSASSLAAEPESPPVLQFQSTASATTVQPEAILDDNNLLPFAFLRKGDRVGRCVLKIERADRAVGTGFLVAPDILLTNHHVLPDARTAAHAHARANYEAEPPADPAGRPLCVPLDPGTLFVTNADLDFTFCGVTGLDDLGSIAVDRDSLIIMPSEYVNIIQHPRGRPKEVALQDSRVVKVDNVVVQYSCDTEPGSSGSPVFNNQWRLVALHHASVATGPGQGGRTVAGAAPGARFLNEGIRLSAIAIWLESVEANAPETRDQVARLRQIFAGLDTQLGFFGGLGRKAGQHTAAEMVVEAYRSRSGHLDLAFWNLAHLADVGLDYLPELGWTIAGMGIDVWCLTHLDRDVLNALADHLDTHFRLDYRVLPGPDTVGAPLAALVRRGAARHVSWCEDGGHPPRLVLQTADRSRTPRRFALVPTSPGARADTTFDGDSADLWLLGGALNARDLHHLAGTSPHLQAAIGPDGGLAIIPGSATMLDSLFVSPNLDQTLGGPGPLVVVHDRRWPPAAETLDGPKPIAARLVLGAVEPSRSTASREAASRRLRADAPHLHPPLAPFRTRADDDNEPDTAIDPHLAALLDDPELEARLRTLLDALRTRRREENAGKDHAGPATP